MNFTIYELLILVGLPSIITLIFQTVWLQVIKRRRSGKEEDQMTKRALQALLRNELRSQYVVFINQGWVVIDDKSNFSNMYDIYHTLGQNGVMDEMCRQVLELPTRPPKVFTRRKEDHQ